jgi:NAD-dependent SIR2 family protein deacetylase
MFCQMIAQLSELSQAASPTPFHQALRSLDERGRLLRVYTQNIDAIELKTGLSFGVPEFDKRRARPRSKPKSIGPPIADQPSTPNNAPCPSDSAPGSRYTSPVVEVPRCIPLHGTLQTLHCQTCMHTFPLENHVSSLTSGTPPYCPECTQMEETRQLVGKRARGVGKLRPSVVLYNELHKDGEGVGEVVRRDLVGGSKGKGWSGADALLVVGTSLRVPGTKRMVREFSKAVRARGGPSSTVSASTGLATPSPSPGKGSATSAEDFPIKSIYLNFDFPAPTREWEGVFDAWLQGDAQSFGEILMEEITKEAAGKEAALERKRKREQDTAPLEGAEETGLPRKKTKTEKLDSGKPVSKQSTKASGTPSVRPRNPKIKRREDMDITSASTPMDSSKLIIRIPPRPRVVPEVCITRGLRAIQHPYTPTATHHNRPMTPLSHSDATDDSDLSEVEPSHNLEVADELPIGHGIRTAQYGLLATG